MATYDYTKYSKVKSPTGYDIYEGSNKLSYEQAKPMFSSGFNVDFIKEGPAPQAISPTQPISQPQSQMPTGAPASMPAQTGLSKVSTQGVGPDGKPIYDVFAGQEHIQDPNDPRLKGVNIDHLPVGQAPQGFKSKFQEGFEKAQGAGLGNVSDASQGRKVVSDYTELKNDTKALGFLQGDEFFTNLTKTFQEFTNPINQRASLADTYSQMIKDSGIEAMDMELINTKNIIEGSEEDIRTEITKAGGFATESQVLAMTNSRNKQLIKNYNTLLDTRNAKEKYLDTLIGLESQDREAADQRFEQAFNMQMQIADYGIKMQKNAVDGISRLKDTIGWSGIYEATQGDPYAVSLIEKAYGLPSGGLTIAAQQDYDAQYQAEIDRSFELEEKSLGIANLKSQIADRGIQTELDRRRTESQLATDAAQRNKIYNDINKSMSTGQPVVISATNLEDTKNNLSTLFSSDSIPAALRGQASKALNIVNKLNEMVKDNPGGNFAGGRFRSALAPFIPGSLEPKFQKLKADEAKIRQDLVTYITGAAYTNLQADDVNKLIPRSQLYDGQNRERINNLANTIMGDLEAGLIASGVNAQLPRFNDLFSLSSDEVNNLMNQLSPDQKVLLQSSGLIK